MTGSLAVFGPDRPPTRARVVELAAPTGYPPGRTQYPAGHLLGDCHATIYGRTGATATELEAIAATALAMAARMRGTS